MVVLGSASLASLLLQLGLVDEYRIILTPVLIGAGTPLFRDVNTRLKLQLLSMRSFASGVVVLCYQRDVA